MNVTQSICAWINDLVEQGNKQAEEIKELQEKCKGYFTYVEDCAPTIAGSDGDTYIQLSNGNIYKYEDGKWVNKGAISLNGGTF